MFKNFLMSLVMLLPSFVFACTGPKNLYGIQFNNGEVFDTSIIESMGTKGINYFEGIDGYIYQSHYKPFVMVQLLHSRLNLLISLPDSQLNDFPFGECLRSELDWLAKAGILSMDSLKRVKIEQSFTALGIASGGLLHGQNHFYWTKQDTLLPGGIIVSNGSFLPVDCWELLEFRLPSEALGSSLGVKSSLLQKRAFVKKSNCFLVNGRFLYRQKTHFGILVQNGSPRIGGRK